MTNGRTSIPLPAALATLLTITLLIPLMWLTGHRGNNTFIVLCLVFLLLLRLSPDLKHRTHQFIIRLAHDPRTLRRSLIALLLPLPILLAAHFADPFYKITNLDHEGAAGTTYAGFLLAAAAYLAWLASRWTPRRSHRRAWTILTILFAFITLDELSEFHHGAARWVYWIFTGRAEKVELVDGLAFWMIMLSPLALVIIAGLVWFIRNILHPPARRLAVAALSLWIASQGLEATISAELLPKVYETALEETIEMLGSIFFLAAFLRELAGRLPVVRTGQPAETAPRVSAQDRTR